MSDRSPKRSSAQEKPRGASMPPNRLPAESRPHPSHDHPLVETDFVPEEGLVSVAQSIQYSGPLPPPKHLDYYEKIQPGAADRIITMAEKEQDFRHAMKKSDMEQFWQDQCRRRRYTFVHALCVCVVAGLATYWGSPIAGASIMALTVAGAYLSCHIEDKTAAKEHQAKAEEPEKPSE